LPVVDIKTNSYDVLGVLSDLAGKAYRVGIVGYATVVRDCKKVADILGIDSYSILFEETAPLQYDTLHAQVRKQLEHQPIDVMIGDTIPQCYFMDLCGQFRLVPSGKEAIREALERASAFLKVLERERASSKHLTTLLDMFEKAVFSLDQEGRITHANQAAAQFFGMSRALMLGKPIEAIDPALGIAHETIAHGIRDVGQLITTRQGRMVCHQYPIKSGNQCLGIVLALERVERVHTIEQKIRHQEQQTNKFTAYYRLSDYVTRDPEMQMRLALLRNYAQTDATILITGESGTGKELLAQGIHSASQRAGKPFVAVNCGALPPMLLESELFGYVDGAFTGASRKGKRGLFELAHKGTIFLDEISELDKSLQTRLLRVIQERQLMRLGSEDVIPVDIRIIAATNQNLEEMVAQGKFREDLFYRLNVLKFEPVPLRARPRDIIPSALALLQKHARRYQREVTSLDDELQAFLLRYQWPGNLRELSNVIERIAITSPEPEARLAALKPVLSDLTRTPRRSLCSNCELTQGSLDDIRCRIVLKVIAEENNCKSQAAKRLGVDRTTLNRWLRGNEHIGYLGTAKKRLRSRLSQF
jgi:transcriptional regulator with PAS, ATPase and Fis domain